MLKKFWRNKEGNIAMVTALSLVPMLAVLGAGVDFVRLSLASSELQAATDSAVLAAANLNNSGNITTVANEYVDANLTSNRELTSTLKVVVDKSVALNFRTVTVNATATIPTYFIHLLGIDEFDLDAESVATQSITNVEIALVLDISSSMKGNRLTNLKSAAVEFIEQVLDEDSTSTTSISLIPFGGTVNVGEDLFDTYAVPLGSAANQNPKEDDYDIGSDIPDGKFRFPGGHADYCLEYRSKDFNDSLLEEGVHSQVPHFWKWSDFNPWCPMEESAVFLNSNDKTELIDHINGMNLSDGTGMDIGAMWGLKALSPKWSGKLGGDFVDRPAVYDENTLKILVVMSDGGITAQLRPEDYKKYSTHTNRSEDFVADGAGTSNQGNNNNQQTLVESGNSNTTATQDKAVGYFKRVCDDAHTAGAVVYTIGFQISEGSIADHTLDYCSSDASKYYFVESLNINSAFNSIAASVNALRITE